MKILVVDDEAVCREPIGDILKEEGYLVDLAEDTQSAREFLQKKSYKVLLCDLHIPGDNNLEFLKESVEKFPNMSVVLMTGKPTLETSLEALRLRVVDYLVKPVQQERLIEIVRQAFARALLVGATHQIKDECSKMTQEIIAFEAAVTKTSGLTPAQQTSIPEQLLDMTLAHIFRSTLNFRVAHRMLQSKEANAGGVDHEFCHMIGCPARSAYEQAIQDTIKTLEATRGSFKSKELGELRVKLVALLKRFEGPHL